MVLDGTRVGQEVDGASAYPWLSCLSYSVPDQEPSAPERGSLLTLLGIASRNATSVSVFTVADCGRARQKEASRCAHRDETSRHGLSYMHFLPRCWHSKGFAPLMVNAYTTEAHG